MIKERFPCAGARCPTRTYHPGSARHSRCRVNHDKPRPRRASMVHVGTRMGPAGGERAALYCQLRSQPRDRPAPAGRIAPRSAEKALMREFGRCIAQRRKERRLSEQCKRDSHPRDKDSNNERQVILIEGNNPLHGPHPAFGYPKDSCQTTHRIFTDKLSARQLRARAHATSQLSASVPRDQCV